MSALGGFSRGVNSGIAIAQFVEDRERAKERQELAEREYQLQKQREEALERNRLATLDYNNRALKETISNNEERQRVANAKLKLDQSAEERQRLILEKQQNAEYLGNQLRAFQSAELKYGDTPDFYVSPEYKMIVNDIANHPDMRKNLGSLVEAVGGVKGEFDPENVEGGVKLHFVDAQGARKSLMVPHDTYEAAALATMRNHGAHHYENEVRAYVSANMGVEATPEQVGQATQGVVGNLNNFAENLADYVQVEGPPEPKALSEDQEKAAHEIYNNRTAIAEAEKTLAGDPSGGDYYAAKKVLNQSNKALEQLYKDNPIFQDASNASLKTVVDDRSARLLKDKADNASGMRAKVLREQADKAQGRADKTHANFQANPVKLTAPKRKQLEIQANKRPVGAPQINALEKLVSGKPARSAKERETAIMAYIGLNKANGLTPDGGMIDRLASGDFRTDEQREADKALLDARIAEDKAIKAAKTAEDKETLKVQIKTNEAVLDGIVADLAGDDETAKTRIKGELIRRATRSSHPMIQERRVQNPNAIFMEDRGVFTALMESTKQAYEQHRSDTSGWGGKDIDFQDQPISKDYLPQQTSKEKWDVLLHEHPWLASNPALRKELLEDQAGSNDPDVIRAKLEELKGL